MRRRLLIGLLASLALSAQAQSPSPADDPAGSPITMEERAAVFGEIDAMLQSGQKARTADALVAIVDDPAQVRFHAESYARLGAVLRDLDLPYAALVAFERGLSADANGVSSTAKDAIALGESVGDTALLEPVFAANVGLDVDAATRSEMAYLAARESYYKGSYGTALAILKMVRAEDPVFPEARSLEGVVLSQQGRPSDALAPLLMAQAKATELDKDASLRNAITMNLARAYFAAENFPRAIENYAVVERGSKFWAEAQFERAWAHFRLQDMNGTLGLLHTIQSPFFDEWYFPEAELLRVYALFLLCKFPDASDQITAFQAHYKPVLGDLQRIAASDPAAVFGSVRAQVEDGDGDLPRMLTRFFDKEERFLDSVTAVQRAEDEVTRLRNVSANPVSARAASWVQARRDAIVAAEGERVRARAARMADELDRMLADSEISKLDLMQMETRLYEQASVTGEMPSAKRRVERKVSVKRGYVYWPWQGEYWADELGFYRIETKPECPESLQTGR